MHLALAILKTAGQLRKAAARVLRDHDLTPAQFNVLNLLSDQPGGLSAGTLADELVVDPSNITGLVQRMKRDGFLLTSPAPNDARSHLVRLSAKGKTRWQKAHTSYAAELARLDQALSAQNLSTATLAATGKTLTAIGAFCRELFD